MRVKSFLLVAGFSAALVAVGVPDYQLSTTKAKGAHPRMSRSQMVAGTAMRPAQDAQPQPPQPHVAVKVEPGEQRELIKSLEKQLGQEVSHDKQTGVIVAELTPRSRELFATTYKATKGSTEVRALATSEVGNVTAVDSRQVVAQFEPNTSQAQIDQTLRGAGDVVRKEPGNRYVVEVPDNTLTESVAQNLSQQEGVSYAVQNPVLIFPPRPTPGGRNPGPGASSPSNTFPSDPLFRSQWGLENRGTPPGRVNADIRVKPVLRTIPGSDSIKIAILDEGVDTSHPDLRPKIIRPYNALKVGASVGDTTDDPDTQKPNRWDVHGTACAGIAAALTNNGLGISGVAGNAKIIPIKVAEKQEGSEEWITSGVKLATGIRQAVARGADVISLSWGGNGWVDLDVEAAIRYAVTQGRGGRGTVVVAAVGNFAVGSIDFPAILAGARHNSTLPIIAVGATNANDELITKANCTDARKWGSNTGAEVTVVAPGIDIPTTDNVGSAGSVPSDYVMDFNGTSSATPLVAGVAALILSQHPDWTAQQVRDQIANTADDLGAPNHDDLYGFGRVNACRALALTDCGGIVSRLPTLWPWRLGTIDAFSTSTLNAYPTRR